MFSRSGFLELWSPGMTPVVLYVVYAFTRNTVGIDYIFYYLRGSLVTLFAFFEK